LSAIASCSWLLAASGWRRASSTSFAG
jgi:hypothetical protein